MRLRLRGLLSAFDWKYAIVEISLIVVGVLLALAVNNWNTSRQDRASELSLLADLHSSLTLDVGVLKEVQTVAQSRKAQIESLRDHVCTGKPYAASLNSTFGLVLGIWPIHFNRSPYEVLKAKGLDLVSRDALRLLIVRVYDQVYPNYQDAQNDDRNVVFEVVRPYYLKAIRDIRFRETATPVSYDYIVRDTMFSNVVDYRLRSLEVNTIEPTVAAIKDVSELLQSLNLELGRKR
jgi:hypothetical protein